MNRHEQRVIAMEALYQNLLLNKDIRRSLFESTHGQNEIDPFLYSLTIDLIEHKDAYIQDIEKKLREDWTFDRLSLLEQCILLLAYQEMHVIGTAKPVVIDEAVNLAKAYCDDTSYKLINGILDRL
ncbi:transcription antitermination factor NusB [uncultured Faecalicoccus sp.]|uniref:transcription antitermination factor NusB n=1 Tax=uncultured Faecalicoccus sp. TaxID=1971760 RepID=UPI002622224B|nr:transcription antitermination factor NusB [uncultured Faecalicoccus sp.]